MYRAPKIMLVVAACSVELPVVARQSPAASIKVCQLLPRPEVKKLIGGIGDVRPGTIALANALVAKLR